MHHAVHDSEPRLIELIDWAREFLATEVEGQYTSDAALHLALAVWYDERRQPKATLPAPAPEPPTGDYTGLGVKRTLTREILP